MSKELIGSHSVHETLMRQTQIDAARIEELEREVERKMSAADFILKERDALQADRDEWKARAEFSYRQRDELNRLCEFNEKTMSALQADNARLREALTHSDTLLRDLPNSGGFYGLGVMENNAEAISSTPDQSLAAYRNKVIEAFVNEFSRHVGGDGEFWLHELQEFAMKEQPLTSTN